MENQTKAVQDKIKEFCNFYIDSDKDNGKREIVLIGELHSYQHYLDEYDKRNLDISKGKDWRNPNFNGPAVIQYGIEKGVTLLPMTAYIMKGKCEVFLHSKDFDYEKEEKEHQEKEHFKEYGSKLYS